MKRVACVLAGLLAAQPGGAAAPVFCDGGPVSEADIATAVSYGRTFAEGAVTLFQVFPDGNLPNGVLLGVLSPMRGDLAGSGLYEACTLIYSSRDEISYVNWVDIDGADATYDPTLGLQINVPVRHYVGMGEMADGDLQILVDQDAGSLAVDEVLP